MNQCEQQRKNNQMDSNEAEGFESIEMKINQHNESDIMRFEQ